MSQTINLVCATGPWRFWRLVHEALEQLGVAVNVFDYRRWHGQLDPRATTIVLRGESERVPELLAGVSGKIVTWTLEDPMKDGGNELARTAAYADEVWLHWRHPAAEAVLEAWYPAKPVKVVGCLACDQRVFRPQADAASALKDIGVLHYGCLTPRRERLLAKLRLCHGLAITQVQDANHERIAALIRRSKVVLNLHAWSDLNVEIRLAEALSCGALVVSEQLPEEALPGPLPVAIAASGDHADLAEKIKDALQRHARLVGYYRVETDNLRPLLGIPALARQLKEALLDA